MGRERERERERDRSGQGRIARHIKRFVASSSMTEAPLIWLGAFASRKFWSTKRKVLA